MKLFPLVCLLLAFSISPAVSADRPNIIVILSDDMGFSDIGCYGSEIATPNLDALAQGGVRFTQFYNTARCCPTRASLLTGLHPHQAGIGHMMEDRGLEGYRGNLNRNSVTIAEALQPAGYRTYAAGKWHVTPGQSAKELSDQSNWPMQRGFQRFYGTIHGAGSFWDPSALVRDNRQISIANDPEYAAKDYYYTDAISDQAARFVREHRRDHQEAPFFLYVAYTAAHWPMHAREADIEKYRGKYDAGYEAVRQARWEKQKRLGVIDAAWKPSPLARNWDDVKDPAFEARCMEVYAAMVDSMDQGIGKLVAELKAQGQLDNTLLFYLQDNGGCAETVGRGANPEKRGEGPTLPPMSPEEFQFNSIPKQTRDGWPVRQGYGVMPGGPDTYVAYGEGWANVSNTPFREYKHWVHEGGIATPLIAHWPGGMKSRPPEGIVRQPGQLMDIMATVLDVTGATYPEERNGQKIVPHEGVSLRPALAGEPVLRTQPLVWEHEGNRAVRDGKWKLVAKGPEGPWELYDMDADRTETTNLAGQQPELVKEFAGKWQAWAERAKVLPWPWKPLPTEGGGSDQTRFELGPEANLPRAQAPNYLQRPFSVVVEIAEPGDNGVLVAQGGARHGWALYLQDGTPTFVLTRDGGTEEILAPEKITTAGTLSVRLAADRSVKMLFGDRVIASAKIAEYAQELPADGLQVGRDMGGPVGRYRAPFRFNGKITRAVVELGER